MIKVMKYHPGKDVKGFDSYPSCDSCYQTQLPTFKLSIPRVGHPTLTICKACANAIVEKII